MKKLNFYRNTSPKNKHAYSEDLRILQRKLSGASVYRSVRQAYKRFPKHRKNELSMR